MTTIPSLSRAMTEDELRRFDQATEHPYECRCALCQEWWELMGPEEDGESDDDEPAF